MRKISILMGALALSGCGDGKSKSQHFAECQMNSTNQRLCMQAAGYVYYPQCRKDDGPFDIDCYWDENLAFIMQALGDDETKSQHLTKCQLTYRPEDTSICMMAEGYRFNPECGREGDAKCYRRRNFDVAKDMLDL